MSAGADDGVAQRILALSKEPELSDRYRLLRALGRGGMSVVIEGEQVSTGRRVAVKFMLRMDDPVALGRLEREGRALARVAHPGLVRVLDAGTVAGYPYLVTELMTGESLSDRIHARGRLAPEAALTAAREILPALAACHQAGVVHRDVKPANVLFDAEGAARLSDFGTASWSAVEARLTETGAVMGTPLYVAPEMLSGEPGTAASDMYAFGATLHEALSGDPPFRDESLAAILLAHRKTPPPRLEGLVKGVPRPIADLVFALLAKAPSERPTAAKALEVIEAVARPAAPRPSDIKRLEPRVPEPPPRHGVAVGAAVLVVVAVCAYRALAPAPPASSPTIPEIPASASTRPARAPRLGDGGGPAAPALRGRVGSHWGVHPRIVAMSVSPDGARLATATGNSVASWNVAARRLEGFWRPGAMQVLAAAPGPGPSEIALAYSWDSPLRPRAPVPNPPADSEPLDFEVRDLTVNSSRNVEGWGYAGAFALAPGGRCAAGYDALAGHIEVLALEANGLRLDRGPAPPPLALALSADGSRVAALFADHAELRRAEGTPLSIALPGASAPATSGTTPALALSPDGALLAISARGTLAVHETSTGVVRASVAAPGGTLALAFAPDGRSLARLAGGEVVVHATDTLAVRERHPASGSHCLAFPAGAPLVETDRGFAPAGDVTPVPPRCIAVDPDARFAVFALGEGAFSRWDAHTGEERRLDAGPGRYAFEGLARDGSTLDLRREGAPGATSDVIVPLDLTTGRPRRELTLAPEAHAIPLSGGRQLVIAEDFGVRVIDAAGRERALTSGVGPSPYTRRPRRFELLDRTERWLALARSGRGVVLVDLLADAARLIWPPEAMEGEGRAGAFLDAPRVLALGTGDGVMHMLPLGQRGNRPTLGPAVDALIAMNATPDGKRALAGHSSGAVVLWDLEGGKSRILTDRAALEVRAVGLDATSATGLSTDDTGVLSVWELPPPR